MDKFCAAFVPRLIVRHISFLVEWKSKEFKRKLDVEWTM